MCNVCECPILFSQETLLFLRYCCKHTISMKHFSTVHTKNFQLSADQLAKCTGQIPSSETRSKRRRYSGVWSASAETQFRPSDLGTHAQKKQKKRTSKPASLALLLRSEPPPTAAATASSVAASTASSRRPLPPPRQVPW